MMEKFFAISEDMSSMLFFLWLFIFSYRWLILVCIFQYWGDPYRALLSCLWSLASFFL